MATPGPYLPSPSLITDFYEVTMGYGYWKSGKMETPSVFTLYFRTIPFNGGYAVAAGLETVMDFLDRFAFSEEEIRFLGSFKSESGGPLFEAPFLEFLAKSRFSCDVEAVTEGTLVFPNEPILKVKGPLWQCQWIESALLNIMNFQTLIATKAARVVEAARGGTVLEFGLRRAQGFDGALTATRASYIGGVHATSNVLAGKLYGIPLRGTHAHSWIMAFDSEEEAFRKYAEALPDQCILLVDTYDTREGVRHAIEVGRELKARGRDLAGIRLDSGDFAYLSQEARAMLDAAGLKSTRIFASNELDEHLIQSLFFQGAKIDAWGVGTKLVTAEDQPAMNGVYKLAAIEEGGKWKPRIKVSDQPAKTSNPGIPRIRRFFDKQGLMEGDLIYDESENADLAARIMDPVLPHRFKAIAKEWRHEELLRPVFSKGKRVYAPPPLAEVRAHREREIERLHPGIRRLENPHVYPVGLSPHLAKLKADLIQAHVEKRSP